MNQLAKAMLITALLFGGALVTIVPGAEASTNVPFFFGMESSSVSAQTNAGVKPDVGALWVGPWTLKSGWGGPDSAMRSMRDQGVTPAIHFYYWGDDISPSCIENGCWSSLHNTHKNKAGWQTLAQQLTDHLNSQMQGKEVLIFIETEFNKGGVGSYEPMDGYMADKASFIKNKYPNAKIVTAFGNWDSGNWHRFDRIAAKSDFIGLQAMRGSTRDSWSEYDTAYEKTLTGSKKMKSLFGKPILIHDLALSSYPESSYKTKQANELKQFFTGIGELKSAGVKGLIYRSWYDNPNFDLKNYYGEAERHWGVVYSGGGYKTSANVWIDGVKATRAGTTTSGSTGSTGSTGTFSASFSPQSGSNEWWVDVKVSGTKSINKVEAKVNGGSYQTLSKSSWGTWTKSMHAPKGSDVVFRATASDGSIATSGTYKWLGGTSTTTTSPSTLSASFSPQSGSNEWWVDVKVSSTKTISKVETKVNGGSYQTLSKSSWGTWTKSMHAPKGSDVAFRATASDGSTATSGTYKWLGGTSSTTTTSSFDASFNVKDTKNNWWVEVYVTGKGVTKVEVRADYGSWTTLPKENWGAYAKSLYIKDGAKVQFRATDSNGQTDHSQTIIWS